MIRVTEVRTAHLPVHLDTMDVCVPNVVHVPLINSVILQEGVYVTQPVETVPMKVFSKQGLFVYIEVWKTINVFKVIGIKSHDNKHTLTC